MNGNNWKSGLVHDVSFSSWLNISWFWLLELWLLIIFTFIHEHAWKVEAFEPSWWCGSNYVKDLISRKNGWFHLLPLCVKYLRWILFNLLTNGSTCFRTWGRIRYKLGLWWWLRYFVISIIITTLCIETIWPDWTWWNLFDAVTTGLVSRCYRLEARCRWLKTMRTWTDHSLEN